MKIINDREHPAIEVRLDVSPEQERTLILEQDGRRIHLDAGLAVELARALVDAAAGAQSAVLAQGVRPS